VLDKKFRSEDGPVIAVMCTTDEEHPELVLFTAVNIDRQEANQVIMEAGLSALHAVRMVKKIDSIPMLGTGKTDYTALAELVKCL
jgi:long-chain-fatty-acid--[acyl-carrier-protein] ligase